jgi:hypothetical protein
VSAVFGVVVKVPAAGEFGNLALTGDVYVDAQAFGGSYDDAATPMVEVVPDLFLWLRHPVFKLGELLVMEDGERDQFGRKPSKWSVTVDEFHDVYEAVARVHELRAEHGGSLP